MRLWALLLLLLIILIWSYHTTLAKLTDCCIFSSSCLFILHFCNRQNYKIRLCGAGGSMHVFHGEGPRSIPGQDKFPGWGFFRGFCSPVRQMSGKLRPPRFPNTIWPSLSSIIIIHYGRQWPEMLTVPKTSNTHLYIHSTPETLCEKHFRQWILSNKFMLQIVPSLCQ